MAVTTGGEPAPPAGPAPTPKPAPAPPAPPATADPRLGPAGGTIAVVRGCCCIMGAPATARGMDVCCWWCWCCWCCEGRARTNPVLLPRGWVGGARPAPDGPRGGVAWKPLTGASAMCCRRSGCIMAVPGPLARGGGDMPLIRGPLGGERVLDGGGEWCPVEFCSNCCCCCCCCCWCGTGDAVPRELTPEPNAGDSGNRLGRPRGEPRFRAGECDDGWLLWLLWLLWQLWLLWLRWLWWLRLWWWWWWWCGDGSAGAATAVADGRELGEGL